MDVIGDLLILALNILFFIIILEVIVSWLMIFEVVNVKSPQAQNLIRLLGKITGPIYKPLRKYIPPIGGLDITPIIVLFGIRILQGLIAEIFYI